jgi:hypothetical protein
MMADVSGAHLFISFLLYCIAKDPGPDIGSRARPGSPVVRLHHTDAVNLTLVAGPVSAQQDQTKSHNVSSDEHRHRDTYRHESY